MRKNPNPGDLIDMMGARFEMVARMGSNESDPRFTSLRILERLAR